MVSKYYIDYYNNSVDADVNSETLVTGKSCDHSASVHSNNSGQMIQPHAQLQISRNFTAIMHDWMMMSCAGQAQEVRQCDCTVGSSQLLLTLQRHERKLQLQNLQDMSIRISEICI